MPAEAAGSAGSSVVEASNRGEQRPLPLWRQRTEEASLDYHRQRVAAYEAVHALRNKGADVADMAVAYAATQDFATMLRQREGERLDAWGERIAHGGIDDLARFALGLRDDYAAVRAALTLDYSNGQVEGQVHRLKLVRRSMYGRGRFDLLERRVLDAA